MSAIDLRYARALAAVISDQKLDVVATEGQLNEFANLLEASAELREVLMNPSIPEPQKLGVLDVIAARNGMSKAVRNFIALIAHHERLHELREMVASFHAIADEETHVAEAEVISARPLDDHSKKLIEQKVADMTGGERVKAIYSQDASLLGGAIVKVGSTVYDGSVRAQLAQLKQRLVGAV
jgi:F-type H+-transporting ATPase subunit delta